MMTININHHYHVGKTSLETVLERLTQMEGRIMAKLEDFQAALAAVDAETTRIADYIQQLLAKLQTTGLSETEEAQVLADLNAATDRLRSVGTSVENPVPTTPLPPV